MTVCAVVVTYQPDAALIDNVRLALEQVERLTIVDNGTTGQKREYVTRAADLSERVELIELGENQGIASALNVVARDAGRRGCEWLLELDQDSTVTPGMVRTMLDAYDAYPEPDKVAVLAPAPKEMATGQLTVQGHRGSARKDPRWREVLWGITSGSLTKVAVFDRVGLYDDGLFIDCVDMDYCLNCARHGYRTLQVPGALLQHRLGEKTRHRFLWRHVYASNHSAVRRYYMARNRLIMLRRYFSDHPIAMLRIASSFYYHHFLKVLLYERDKAAKIRCIGRGLWDWLRGVRGPMR